MFSRINLNTSWNLKFLQKIIIFHHVNKFSKINKHSGSGFSFPEDAVQIDPRDRANNRFYIFSPIMKHKQNGLKRSSNVSKQNDPSFAQYF